MFLNVTNYKANVTFNTFTFLLDCYPILVSFLPHYVSLFIIPFDFKTTASKLRDFTLVLP